MFQKLFKSLLKLKIFFYLIAAGALFATFLGVILANSLDTSQDEPTPVVAACTGAIAGALFGRFSARLISSKSTSNLIAIITALLGGFGAYAMGGFVQITFMIIRKYFLFI